MPAAFPVEPEFTFQAGNGHKPFAVENRAETGEPADFNAFTSYMAQFEPDNFLRAMSDFHVLVYMYTCDMLPLKVGERKLFTYTLYGYNHKLFSTAKGDKDNDKSRYIISEKLYFAYNSNTIFHMK